MAYQTETGSRSADLNLGYIDLNRASERDIAQLPGVGSERAKLIVDHRPFGSMDDVKKVPGFTDQDIEILLQGGAVVGESTPPVGAREK